MADLMKLSKVAKNLQPAEIIEPKVIEAVFAAFTRSEKVKQRFSVWCERRACYEERKTTIINVINKVIKRFR